MAKVTGPRYKHPYQATWPTVQMPADGGVQRLLTGCGTLHEGLFNEFATHADPKWGAQRAVRYPGELRGALAEEIAVVLRRAREAEDPAADALAGVAAQLGVAAQ
jgi:hypothetical protein